LAKIRWGPPGLAIGFGKAVGFIHHLARFSIFLQFFKSLNLVKIIHKLSEILKKNFLPLKGKLICRAGYRAWFGLLRLGSF
jgi:hypothetical protein